MGASLDDTQYLAFADDRDILRTVCSGPVNTPTIFTHKSFSYCELLRHKMCRTFFMQLYNLENVLFMACLTPLLGL